LWHRIFGSPEQQTKKIVEGPPSDEQLELEREVREELKRDEVTTVQFREEFVEEAAFIEDVEVEGSDARESSGEEGREEGEETRKRRPRRRRRGRGGRRNEESGDREPRAKREGDRSKSSEPREAPRRHADPSDLDLDLGDDEDEDDLDSPLLDDGLGDEEDGEADGEEGRSDRAVPPSHRNIPTWEDAIGVIVDANRQNHSERKRSPHSSPRGGSSRGGRSRGRRKKT
jgi:ribonuclease E